MDSNSGEVRTLESLDLAHKIVDILSDKQAVDIILLDAREVCSFADYFVICSGESSRQINALRAAVTDGLNSEGRRVSHEEGTAESGWILLDYGDVIVHIFAPFERDYYQLDKFWETACTKIRVP
jgi:ribosome-associated protein